MIDPAFVTNFEQTDEQLEEFILFWVAAAGKNGTTASRCLDKFLNKICYSNMTPFQAIRNKCSEDNMPDDILSEVMNYKTLSELMRESGMGCYKSKSRSFVELAYSGLDLKTCTTEDLEKIHGIGPKTSRCFIMHSRRGARVAGLDTHILKYLKASGVKNVPKSTPGSKKEYLRLEKEFLKIADNANMPPAELDLMIWNMYSVKSKNKVGS